MPEQPQCLYFGVWRKPAPGHYLYNPDGGWADGRRLPFLESILDAGLLPQKEPQYEGYLHRALIGGWTILSFWDRSGDSRPGSNSSFLVRGEHSTADALEHARAAFPHQFARFNFPLQETARA